MNADTMKHYPDLLKAPWKKMGQLAHCNNIMHVYWTGLSACVIRCIRMETTESKAISSLSGYMYFADISIVNSGVCEAYAQVYHLV